MIEFGLLFAIAILLFMAYVISLYSIAVYLDPDEIAERAEQVPSRRSRVLSQIAHDPLAFVQVANIFRLFAIIVVTICVIMLSREVVQVLVWPDIYVFPAALVVSWMLGMFFLEYLPRRSSRRAANRQSGLRFLGLVTLMYVMLGPVVRMYRNVLSHTPSNRKVTEEEKEEIVERAIETLAEQSGISETIIEADEKEMIGRIFQLDQTKVKEIMSPRIDIEGIERSSGIDEIRDLVREHGYSRYPVYEETVDKVTGILYVKDLFSNLGQGDGNGGNGGNGDSEFSLADFLRTPYFIPESMVISDLLREFRARQLHIAIVVDEYGGVAGLVTLEDILEEIVGEIQDEHDFEEAEWRVLPDGRHEVDASLSVERLQEYLETDYPQGDYETVGGLIYDLVGSVPSQGEKISWRDVEFEISELEGQRIRAVLVYKHPVD